MGGAPYSKDGAQIIGLVGDPETTFNHQHDARFQPNGDVSLFDDHTNLSGPARGVEYAIDFTSGTATVVWQYAATVNTTAMGSFRRYADGSNVIAWGLSPNPAMFTEVDDQGNDVLDVAIGAGDFRLPDSEGPGRDVRRRRASRNRGSLLRGDEQTRFPAQVC